MAAPIAAPVRPKSGISNSQQGHAGCRAGQGDANQASEQGVGTEQMQAEMAEHHDGETQRQDAQHRHGLLPAGTESERDQRGGDQGQAGAGGQGQQGGRSDQAEEGLAGVGVFLAARGEAGERGAPSGSISSVVGRAATSAPTL